MDLSHLSTQWDVPGPWQIREQEGGINNTTRWVDTPVGSYILRIYGADRDPAKARYELEILRALQSQPLSFAIPAPMATKAGDLLARVPLEGREALATLVPVIPGSYPTGQDIPQAYASGQALGELIAALGRVQVPGDVRPYGDLDVSYPGITADPAAALADLPVEPPRRAQLVRLVTDLLTQIPAAYERLPRQIVHGDYCYSNVLMEDGRVTGVLDFEFACPDIRALELAIGLSGWPGRLWGTGDEWAVIDAFGQGYVSRQSLTDDEAAALPFLFRLRKLVSFLYHANRWRMGAPVAEIVAWNLERVLENEAWLAAHGDELLRRARTW